jgi:DNA-binding FadR family transcriptional regulator
LKAISAQDADASREAMRQHLSLSQQRYRNRLREQPTANQELA